MEAQVEAALVQTSHLAQVEQAHQVAQADCIYSTNMYAVINSEGIVVNYCIGLSYEKAIKKFSGYTLVEMTLENSPATFGDKYDGVNFIKGEINA
jgi:hypothetical protein